MREVFDDSRWSGGASLCGLLASMYSIDRLMRPYSVAFCAATGATNASIAVSPIRTATSMADPKRTAFCMA